MVVVLYKFYTSCVDTSRDNASIFYLFIFSFTSNSFVIKIVFNVHDIYTVAE